MSRWIGFTIAIILGILAGLYYGWVINPVEYIDTTPDTLREDFKTDYVLMVAEIYRGDSDPQAAARRLALLGPEAPAEIVQKAIAYGNQAGYGQSDLALLDDLHQALQSWNPNPTVEP